MSTESKKYRAEMRAKANRLGNAKSPEKVDSSDWRPGSPLHADRKTGARPIRARIYKHGGKVQGDRAPKNAGKEPRANGGALSVHDTIGENKREKGSFHEGGFKGGGKAEKACGGGRMKNGGAAAKAKGGKAGDKPKIDPMMSLRTKRTEYLPPRAGAIEELEKRAKATDGDAPMRPAGVTLHKKGGEVTKEPPKVGKAVGVMLKKSGMPAKTPVKIGPYKADDKKEDKREIKTAIHKHDKQMHGGKFTKGLKKGGGAEERANGGKAGGYKSDEDRVISEGTIEEAKAAQEAKLKRIGDQGRAAARKTPSGPFVGMRKDNPRRANGGRLQRDTGGDVLSALSPLAMVLKLAKGEDKPKEEPYWATEQGQKTSKEGYRGGGRAARAKGGRAKGKTNINIIIGGGAGGGPTPNMPPPSAPVRPPPPPQNAPPPPMMGGPGGPPPGPPPGGPPPGGPPMPPPGGPMMRAMGGRTGYMSKEAGAGSGLGRLRKVHKAGQHTPGFRS